MINLNEYIRNCPICRENIIYKTLSQKNESERKNRKCKLCANDISKGRIPWNLGLTKKTDKRIDNASKKISRSLSGRIISDEVRKHMSEGQKGKIFSESHIQKIRENNRGSNNPMYGIHRVGKDAPRYGHKFSLETRKKMSDARRGKKRPISTGQKISEKLRGESNYWRGKHRTEKEKEKIRMTLVAQWKEKYINQSFPNYNPIACQIIDNYGIQHGYNFRHAMNGGEVCVGGYFPDGIDEKNKIIIEIDEKHHFNANGTYKPKDILRQAYLENLGYKIIRLKPGEI